VLTAFITHHLDSGHCKHLWNFVNFYQTTWHNFPGDSHFHNQQWYFLLSMFLLTWAQTSSDIFCYNFNVWNALICVLQTPWNNILTYSRSILSMPPLAVPKVNGGKDIFNGLFIFRWRQFSNYFKICFCKRTICNYVLSALYKQILVRQHLWLLQTHLMKHVINRDCVIKSTNV
jgi:hypothetical protein